MGAFKKYRRAWCSDGCGRRILLTIWNTTHGHVCVGCYVQAMAKADRDEDERRLRRYTDEERARI
jgi:hypothetical protein